MVEAGRGNKDAFDSVILAPRNTERAIELSFYYIGKNLSRELSKQMLAKNKQGRTYIRRDRAGRRRRHVASAPGQTAANRTGNMRRARSFEVQGDRLEFGITDDAPYAKFLENGTRRMRARPSLRNTIRAQQKNTKNAFLRELERQLR